MCCVGSAQNRNTVLIIEVRSRSAHLATYGEAFSFHEGLLTLNGDKTVYIFNSGIIALCDVFLIK